MASSSPKATAKGLQPKSKKMPEGGPSTMERIAKGGNKVMSLAERTKARSKAKGRPKDW